ncbi:MAG: DUF4421 family protein [Flavobacteriales bacterium]|nr:DUF4421 family protein [Flavobacteriales bacterium]MCB9335332.1 DUF4421 family protein [Flavobacteriales bacterium]
MKKIIFLHLLLFSVLTTFSKNDSLEYYTDYSNQLLLKLGTVIKANKLEIENTNSNQVAKFSPVGRTSLGVAFNYKWLGLGVAFGLPSASDSKYKYGETKRLDAQLNIYSKKFGIDVIFQNYNGYYLENPKALAIWDKDYFPQLPKMQSASLGVGGYYFFNNKKFSYKAAYVRNVVQNKSAGSFLLGGYYSLDYAGFEEGAYNQDTITSFIPKELPLELRDSFDIKAFASSTYGLSFGYTYTLVMKRWFINISLAPGFGAKNLRLFNSKGENLSKSGTVSRITLRTALGYNGDKFQIGFTLYSRTANITFENYDIIPSTSNARFFVAKRFNVKRKKASDIQ